MREYMGRFREQVRAREEELAQLSEEHAALRDAAGKRVGDLEARCARLSEANRQLELRRALEADGWAADVALLRKQLAAVDRKLLQMRLIDRLDDDERLDALLDQLQKKAPPVAAAAGKAAAAASGAGRRQQHQALRRSVGSAGAVGGLGRQHHQQHRQSAEATVAAFTGGGHGSGYDGDDALDADPSASSLGGSGGGGSVKSQLAAELRAVRRQLEALDARAAAKAERARLPVGAGAGTAAGALPRGLAYGRVARP